MHKPASNGVPAARVMTAPVLVSLVVASVLALPGACTDNGESLFGPSTSATGGSSGVMSTGSNATSSGGGGSGQSTLSTGGSPGTGGSGGSLGTGGSNASGGSSATSTGGAGAGGPEDCLNNADDDNDGLVDCADPDCSAFACERVPGGGWNGPAILYEGAPGTSPTCPSTYPNLAASGRTGVAGDPATCSDCSCTPPDATCSPHHLAPFSDLICQIGNTGITQNGNCQQFSAAASGAAAFSATAPTTTQMGTSCSHQGGVPTVPALTWMTEAVVCDGTPTTGGGCSGNEECAPRGAAPFGTSICVYQDGTQTCPGGYPNQHVYTVTVSDNRGCTDCTCGQLTPATCTATTDLYTDGACMTADGTVPNDGSCNAQSPPAPKSFKWKPTLDNPGCPPDGGKPRGTVMPSTTLTVCCQ